MSERLISPSFTTGSPRINRNTLRLPSYSSVAKLSIEAKGININNTTQIVNQMKRISKITGLVACSSIEEFNKVIELGKELLDQDKRIEKIVHNVPGGVETLVSRVGDYIEKVEIIPKESNIIHLVFHIKDGVSSFWKDMVVLILLDIEKNVIGVKTSIMPKKAEITTFPQKP